MVHLRRPEAAGRITPKNRGRTRICRLSPGAFMQARDWLHQRGARWEGRPDGFDDDDKMLMQERDT